MSRTPQILVIHRAGPQDIRGARVTHSCDDSAIRFDNSRGRARRAVVIYRRPRGVHRVTRFRIFGVMRTEVEAPGARIAGE